MAAIWNRINTLLLLLVLFALLGVIAMLAAGVRGGPLDPPGAPGSTDSVKLPGTPISQPASDAGFPIVISQPGLYYFTSNINGAAGKGGITITADNVTLDLMGFVLDGPAGSQNGISDLFVSRKNVTVRNGTVRDWSSGIELRSSGPVNLNDLLVVENTLAVNVGSGGILSRLAVRDNTSGGLQLFQHASVSGTEVTDSIISHNHGAGAIGLYVEANNAWIHDNVINSNASDGIMLCSLISPTASRNEITDNQISSNGRYGVNLLNCDGVTSFNLVARNALLNNTSGPVQDLGSDNRIGEFVGGDATITGTNPWSNVVY